MTNIHLPTKEVLDELLKWRDQNKDSVRAIRPIPAIGEGKIIFKGLVEQRFRQEGDIVHHSYYVEGLIEAVSFTYNLKTWGISDVNYIVQWDYPKRDTIQDMITVHATCLAFIAEHGGDVSGKADVTIALDDQGELEVK